LQYEYRGLGDAHADAGNQFIPVTTRSSEHTSSIGRCSVKFAEVVVQGLEQRLVDRNGMALFRVVVITPSRIPNPGNDKLCARSRAGFTSEPSLRLATSGQRYSLGDTLLAALMMIDLNGPDIEAVIQ
jgi:hypothetical protein